MSLADCASTFARRGFLEGFYGKPWTTAQRREMIALMAAHGMNTYFYAPKDDPFHRECWDTLYYDAKLADLGDLVRYTQNCAVDFVYCIAPGLTMRFSVEECYANLLQKLAQVFQLGVRHFGLLLDDIPPELQDENDILQFGDTANAHAALVSKLHTDLLRWSTDIYFIVCPMQYHGRGHEDYIARFGSAIPPQVDIFWTGRNICAETLESEDAISFAKHTKHQPFYWDNYPVNDAEMFQEMHLGPITGRDQDLYAYSAGYACNGMEYFECCKIPFITIAAYLRDPKNYVPAVAWDRAMEEIIGGEFHKKLILFTEQLTTSCLKQQNGPRMVEATESAMTAHYFGETEKALAIMRSFCADLQETKSYLAKWKHPLVSELQKWIKKFNQYCDIFSLAVDCYANPAEKLIAGKLAKNMQAYNDSATVLTEFAFRAFVEKILERSGFDENSSDS
ncbi:MAG: beta-N-acetylglucosaminidase domain-containing protein [Oscillospiraceae bacterium]|jgi:hyaluronoglucosaminidase|nr:beta-N-acetylglucosaminidase domain-containing protein [Oscillospiraceae bacterium]